MSDNLTFAQQAANRGDMEWTNTFAALVQAEALERIAASLEKLAGCVNSGGAGFEILITNEDTGVNNL